MHHRDQWHWWKFATGVNVNGHNIAAGINDTGGKFSHQFASVVDTGGKFATGVNDTGSKFATGVKDAMPPETMRPAANLPPV